MSLPGTLLYYLNRQFLDGDGNPIPGVKVESFDAGLATHKPLYADAALGTELSNPAEGDSEGRLTAFMETGAYDFNVYDSNDVFLYSVEGVEDVGASFLNTVGTTFAAGSRNVTSGYTILDTDYLITVNSTGGADPCLINLTAASTRQKPIGIKNMGTVAVSVIPNGSDTIDDSLTSYAIQAADSPFFRCLWLVPDGISTYYILASHGGA